jgi:hypothetical protein
MPSYRVRLVETYKSTSGKKRTRTLLTANHTAPNVVVLKNTLSASAQRLFGDDFGSRIQLHITKVK